MSENREVKEFFQTVIFWAVVAALYFLGWLLCTVVIFYLESENYLTSSRAIIAILGATIIFAVLFMIKKAFGFEKRIRR
jgi:glucan phosphoethanolaminetransferase (alkaline phosphatase superfamily)